MWRGQGRSFDRSADAASGGYEQWSQQTRGDPSAELSARYAMPAGFGAPAATATTAPAVMPPGFAFTPAPFGMLEPPWVAQARVDARRRAEAILLGADNRQSRPRGGGVEPRRRRRGHPLSAFGGAERRLSSSAPKPGKAALVVAASNPDVDAEDHSLSACGGAERRLVSSAPIRPIGASVASTEGRPVENLYGEYAGQTHESHGKNLCARMRQSLSCAVFRRTSVRRGRSVKCRRGSLT